MEKQFLLEDETISVTSGDGSVILTNKRVLKNTDSTGEAYFISMPLQKSYFRTKGMKRETVLELVKKIESARNFLS